MSDVTKIDEQPAPESEDADAAPVAVTTEKRRRPGWQRALIVVLISGFVLAALALGGVWFVTERYAGHVQRIPNVFSGLDPSQRPAPATTAPGASGPPTTFLLIGSDSRSPLPTTGDDAVGVPGSQRSDVIMLVQIAGDRKSAFGISFPRDSYVPVPGHGTTKINAAYAYGGPTLLIQTIENLTDIRIDHFASVDFYGFKAMTDALGGVDVYVSNATTDRGVTFTQGKNHLDGDQALVYVRQRYGLPGGDLNRVQRQQSYLRGVMRKLDEDGWFTDTAKFDSFFKAVTNSVSVDDQLSNLQLTELARSLSSLKAQDVTFLTAPVAGLGREAAGDVVYLDQAKGAQLWGYIQAGTLSEHVNEFTTLPDVPR